MVYVFLADGFEEVEALTPVDMLRRAGLDVVTVGVGVNSKTRIAVGAHAIPVVADNVIENLDPESLSSADCVILPGGQPGTNNLYANSALKAIVLAAHEKGAIIGAICAAPSILGRLGLLRGLSAVCYPGFESMLEGASVSAPAPNGDSVVVCGRIITARSAAYALDFSDTLITAIAGKAAADRVISSVTCCERK